MIDVYQWDPESERLTVAPPEATPPHRSGEWIWMDLQGEDEDTILEVTRRFGIDPALAEEAASITTLPQVEELDGSVFVVLHGFITGSGERLVTAEIDLFVSSSYLLTIRRDEVPTIGALKARLDDVGGFAVSTPAGLIALMADLLAKRLAPLIHELEHQVDSLEEKAIRGDPQTAVQAHALRRDVILLRRALVPQFDVYEDLSHTRHDAFDDVSKRAFARVANKHRRALESLEAGRALLGSVLETYRGAVNDQTNEIMRVLTVFSAIMLPLGLIAGLWGMNFARLPGTDLAWGFWALLGAMFALAVGVWVYFAWRGFIGAPRLRDLPRAVGLGLVTITVAPVKAVAEGLKQLGHWED